MADEPSEWIEVIGDREMLGHVALRHGGLGPDAIPSIGIGELSPEDGGQTRSPPPTWLP